MAVNNLSMPMTGSVAETVTLTKGDTDYAHWMAGWSIGIAMAALSIGVTIGVLQGLEHTGINVYPYIAPFLQSYYQGLTLHGVLNALVWTTFFIVGFFTYALVHSLNRPLRYQWLHSTGFLLMVVGLVMAAIPMLLNYASVLYTFYPPMQAHWAFYIGLTLVVVGSWVLGWNMFLTQSAWRNEHPGEKQPFIALTICITMALWQLATLGVAIEMLIFVIPWSLGLLPGTDPLLDRSLFWFFGHPLVYFWLLPAYISWYGMLPKQTNGKMFSESLARLAFWLFLILSTPIGFHHQYTDPGIPQTWKFMHSVLTMGVAFPSMLTAFTVVASLEVGARLRGGKGYFAWIRRLNWGDPSYAAQNLAMILFVFGGIGGLINASYNVNLVVHNTTWIPGHFHMTVGSATTLTFFGLSYWLVPALSGKKLFSVGLAKAQAWTWFFGMILFSNGYHALGIYEGAPRRVMLGSASYAQAAWQPYLAETLVGVMLLMFSAIFFFVVMLGTVLSLRKSGEDVKMPIAEPIDPSSPIPSWLDNWMPWVYGAVALCIFSYGPMFFNLLYHMELTSPGFKVW